MATPLIAPLPSEVKNEFECKMDKYKYGLNAICLPLIPKQSSWLKPLKNSPQERPTSSNPITDAELRKF